MPKKKVNFKNNVNLDKTSSLNNYFLCDDCGRQFNRKGQIYVHFVRKICRKLQYENKNICKWCNVEFVNRGNLATHAYHIHGDPSYKKPIAVNQTPLECNVCNKKFAQLMQLRYHIRRTHFNLKAKVPYCEQKKVNQVWFENVQNTNVVIEIKKTGKNSLVMRRLAENTAIKVKSNNNDIIDLTSVYPVTKKVQKVECEYCGKFYVERDYKKHIFEHHMRKKKHQCNNCHRTFQRTYLFMRHVCSQTSKVKGVTNNRLADLKIANIVTLAENAIV